MNSPATPSSAYVRALLADVERIAADFRRRIESGEMVVEFGRIRKARDEERPAGR